jgi:uncharacterized protein YndB with AHSA1/START domain
MKNNGAVGRNCIGIISPYCHEYQMMEQQCGWLSCLLPRLPGVNVRNEQMKFQFSILIPAPREVVWRVAQDTAVRPRWDVRVRRYTVHGVAAPGTPVTLDFRIPFLKCTGKGVFMKFDAPEQSAMKLDAITPQHLPSGGGTWLFESVPGGTRFTTRFNLRDDQHVTFPRWVVRLAAVVDTWRSLRRLKKLTMTRLERL